MLGAAASYMEGHWSEFEPMLQETPGSPLMLSLRCLMVEQLGLGVGVLEGVG